MKIASLAMRDIRQSHIGSRVSATATLGDGDVLDVAGILRWITLTSDTVVLAIEEGDSGSDATEWEFAPTANVSIEAVADI
jgi:hypothetical protein